MSWSKLGASWSKGSELEQAGVSWSELGLSWEAGESWERAGAREASWSELGGWRELGASWSKGSELEQAGSKLEQGEQAGVSSE